ncbi:uncharacterized protein [Temnothorax longispinosus]
MPTCYIQNCTNRTVTKNIKFFQFPKEPVILQQWLKACGKNEGEIKTNSATVCSAHFDESCFEMVWTKPRQKNIPAKQILRLKKGSIPRKFLNLGKKRKRTCEDDNEKIKTLVCTGIPTYGELVQYVQEKQHICPEQIININKNIHEDEHILLSDVVAKETKKDEEIGHEQNVSVQTLLEQLKKSEEEKNKLLVENAQLVEQNKKLNIHFESLEKNMQQESNIAQMEIDKLKESLKTTTDALHKLFTPGQIKILMSPNANPRIRWSSEDITSAIALRSLSPKAYRFLRNVKKLPLPSISILQNWCATFNVQPGILKDVFKIMEDKGQNLSITEKLTILSFDELYISNKVDLERKEQKIYGPYKTCQFIMAKGLFNKWKQPIYFNFDQAMTPNILLTVLQMLHQIEYIVVAVTCDMGSSNVRLWNELNVGINVPNNSKKKKIEDTNKECFITHPADNSLKVFFFCGCPAFNKISKKQFL